MLSTAPPTGFPSLDRALRFAIAHKRVIAVRYHERLRVAEPHDYGVINGSVKVFIYQLHAEDGDGRDRDVWRLLELAKIEACEVLDDTFAGTRGRTSGQHLRWDEVFARVT